MEDSEIDSKNWNFYIKFMKLKQNSKPDSDFVAGTKKSIWS